MPSDSARKWWSHRVSASYVDDEFHSFPLPTNNGRFARPPGSSYGDDAYRTRGIIQITVECGSRNGKGGSYKQLRVVRRTKWCVSTCCLRFIAEGKHCPRLRTKRSELNIGWLRWVCATHLRHGNGLYKFSRNRWALSSLENRKKYIINNRIAVRYITITI